MASTLCSKAPVTMEQLRELPAPEKLSAGHYPVPHIDFVESIHKALDSRNYAITREQYGLKRDGKRLFGTIDLAPFSGAERLTGDGQERGMSIGLRHGNDFGISVNMIAGSRVFVCDNMMFTADNKVMRRKHTVSLDLDGEVQKGIDGVFSKFAEVDEFADRLKNTRLTDAQAKLAIYDSIVNEGVLSPVYLPKVHGWYFGSDDREQAAAARGVTDVSDRTAWGLYNSFTREIKNLAQDRMQERTQVLSESFTDRFRLN